MRRRIIIIVFIQFLCLNILKAQTIVGLDDSSKMPHFEMTNIPICNDDFVAYRYNHFLPPIGFLENVRTPFLCTFSHR